MKTNPADPAPKSAPTHWAIVAVLAAGAALVVLLAPKAFAQAEKPAAAPIPRYQVSAWAVTGERGCYIVDTSTGELWVSHVAIRGGAPQKIGEKLK